MDGQGQWYNGQALACRCIISSSTYPHSLVLVPTTFSWSNILEQIREGGGIKKKGVI